MTTNSISRYCTVIQGDRPSEVLNPSATVGATTGKPCQIIANDRIVDHQSVTIINTTAPGAALVAAYDTVTYRKDACIDDPPSYIINALNISILNREVVDRDRPTIDGEASPHPFAIDDGCPSL